MNDRAAAPRRSATTKFLSEGLPLEDEGVLFEILGQYLKNCGFKVTCVAAAGEFPDAADPDADLLIVNLRTLQRSGTADADPILVLPACSRLGPTQRHELIARIKALLDEAQEGVAVLTFDDLRIDLAAREVTIQERAISLTTREFDLLSFLALRPGQVHSREHLFRQLYQRTYDGADRVLDIRVSQLRRKLALRPNSPSRIKTIWGQGYMFVPNGA